VNRIGVPGKARYGADAALLNVLIEPVIRLSMQDRVRQKVSERPAKRVRRRCAQVPRYIITLPI
jgi:hypothetical protein